MKSIDFAQRNAIAVYFYDLTSQIKSMELYSKLLSQKKKNEKSDLSRITLSHELRAPLTSTLMFLESLLSQIVDHAQRQIILIVISQINLLLCLVNDLLDSKMIMNGGYSH